MKNTLLFSCLAVIGLWLCLSTPILSQATFDVILEKLEDPPDMVSSDLIDLYISILPPPTQPPYVFIADEKIEIDKRLSTTSGDIFSNGKIKFKKGWPSTHTGNLTSVGKIEIKKDNTIIGDVESGDEIKVEGNSVITGTITEYSNVSEIPIPIPIPSLSFAAGGEDITVEQNQRLFLDPGSYNKVKVKKNAELYLASGDYFFNELKLDKEALLSVNISAGEMVINIVKKLNFKKETKIETTPLGDEGSRFLTFNILDDRDIKFEKGSKIIGSFIAPIAKVEMKEEVIFIGSIIAREIKVKKDADFKFHIIPPKLAKGENTTGTIEEQLELPENFSLSQNYPNPFNPNTIIKFNIPESSSVSLMIYDNLGREVATLLSEEMEAGSYEVEFDASAFPSGFYFYRLGAGNKFETKKMVLMK